MSDIVDSLWTIITGDGEDMDAIPPIDDPPREFDAFMVFHSESDARLGAKHQEGFGILDARPMRLSEYLQILDKQR